MALGTKRSAEEFPAEAVDKRQKTRKQWKVPRRTDDTSKMPRAILPGDSGIWATCNKGKERACVGELRDLLNEYAEQLYGSGTTQSASEDAPAAGIESEINAEVTELQQPSATQLFTPIRVDVQCVVFFKTVSPVEPVSFVKKICEDAMDNSRKKRTRFTKRLSPMTMMGRASVEGLEKLALEVIEPHFHQTPAQPRKFAIRPSLRNHNQLSRDTIIQTIARLVGPGHQVDLKNYDLLIVVEVFQNVIGMSVVDDNFERLKRYNLAEIYDPTPNPDSTEKVAALASSNDTQMKELGAAAGPAT